MDAFPDNCVRALIAHELAHVWQGATGMWYPQLWFFGPRADLVEEANWLAKGWGFDQDVINQWDIAHGVRRVVNLEDITVE